MTSSLSPLSGALRVLSAAALIGAGASFATPSFAAGSGINLAVHKVSASQNRDKSRDRGSRSRDRDRSERSDSRSSRDRDRSSRSRGSHDHDSRSRSRSDHRSHSSRSSRSLTTHSRPSYSSRGYSSRSSRSYVPYRGYSSSRYSSPWSSSRSRSGYHRTNYKSGLGISFSFGSPGYSRYRWSPSRYSNYQPAFGPYSHYTRQTTCRPILVQARHHGHYETVEVTQCSNPWDGTYIIQGSERVVNCLY